MLLKLVFARSGYGKTEFIKNRIVEQTKNGIENILLLVPEQFSFVTGNTFLSLLGEKKYLTLEISDFTRLSYQVKNTYGGENQPQLDDGGQAIIMSMAIEGVKDFLTLYAKNLNNAGFINSMLEIHAELKSCNVDLDNLLLVHENIEKSILKRKIHDITLIMKSYDAIIENRYLDSCDDLTRLYTKLSEINYFGGRTVYIDGFNGFTAQEFKILQRIILSAKDVYVTLCSDGLNNSNDDFRTFANVDDTANRLIRIAKDSNVPVAKPIVLNKENRFKCNALKILEKQLFSEHFEPANFGDALEVYLGKNAYSECNYVARKIKSLLRTGEYRCRDFAVVARNINDYLSILQSCFNSYDIPYFEDKRQPIVNQPLINFVSFGFKCVNFSFKTDDIMSFAKTMLLGLTIDEISILENYVIMWKISGKKWADEFKNHPKGFSDSFSEHDNKTLEKINATRKKIIMPLLVFKKEISNANGAEIARAIYNLLINVKADKHLLNMAIELDSQGLVTLAQEQNRIWEMLMSVLDQLVLTNGDRPITPKHFEELFNLVISVQDLGNIPQGLDNIAVASAERSFANSPKVVFVLGANEGVFPINCTSKTLLTDDDRQILSENNIELFSGSVRQAVQEKFIAYSVLTASSEKLFVSYSNSNLTDEQMSPSIIIDELQEIFSDFKIVKEADFTELELIEGKKAAFELSAVNWKSGNVFYNSLKQYFLKDNEYKNVAQCIVRQTDDSDYSIENKEISEKLFKKDMMVSASRVETYYHCPFQYFCKYGLGAMPRRVAEMDPMEVGKVLHFVLEAMFKEYGSERICALTKVDVSESVKRLLSDYILKMGVVNTATTRFKYLFMRLEKTITIVVKRLIEEFRQSDFETKAYEFPIDINSDIKPISVELHDGGSLSIHGVIDRIDIMEKDGKKYIRVVDYKSGQKSFVLSDVLEGLNMQMLIYLICTTENGQNEFDNLVPSGVLYMPVNRTISTIFRNADETEVNKEITKNIKMSGIVLNNETVINGMENDGVGEFIIYGKGDNSSLISAEEIGKLTVKIKSLLCEMGEMLHNGKVPSTPVNGKNYDKTCEFCDYSSVCINKLNKKTREIDSLKSSEALKILDEEADGNVN